MSLGPNDLHEIQAPFGQRLRDFRLCVSCSLLPELEWLADSLFMARTSVSAVARVSKRA